MVEIYIPDEVEKVAAEVIWSGGTMRSALTAALEKMQEIGRAFEGKGMDEVGGVFPALIIKAEK